MKLDRIHQISEIIASIAIVASLIFVGTQVSQNTNAVRVSMAQAAMNSWNDLSLVLVNNDKLLQSSHDMLNPEYKTERFDGADRRWFFYNQAALRNSEVLYYQWRNGNLPDELWASHRQGLISAFRFNSAWTTTWLEFRDGVSPGFRTYVDELQAEAVKIRAKDAAAQQAE